MTMNDVLTFGWPVLCGAIAVGGFWLSARLFPARRSVRKETEQASSGAVAEETATKIGHGVVAILRNERDEILAARAANAALAQKEREATAKSVNALALAFDELNNRVDSLLRMISAEQAKRSAARRQSIDA